MPYLFLNENKLLRIPDLRTDMPPQQLYHLMSPNGQMEKLYQMHQH